MAGLATAGVLAKHCKKVILLERGDLHEMKEKNQSIAAQGHHAHLLFSRGEDILCQLFPGLRMFQSRLVIRRSHVAPILVFHSFAVFRSSL